MNKKVRIKDCVLCYWALYELFSFLARISCIFIPGSRNSTVGEVFTGNLEVKKLQNLEKTSTLSMHMVVHNETILLCGGFQNEKKCLQLDHGTWKEHSSLSEARISHSTVSTHTATFLFGGAENSKTTYEYLPKDSITWIKGKTKIPEGFTNGCAIAVKSGQEILLIGGRKTEKRILCFNVNDHTFQEVPSQLNVMRMEHRCAFIPNTTKVMITGGMFINKYLNRLESTEILDTQDGSIFMASPMKYKRIGHGMGSITINGEDRLAVFGGHTGRKMLDTVELYNTQTKKWDATNMRLKKPKVNFSFLNIKLSEIISRF